MSATQIRGTTQIQAGTIADAQIQAAAGIQTSKLAQGSLFILSTGAVAMGANLSLGNFLINNVGTPSAATDAANKAYVDNVAQGLATKQSVRALASTNVTLSGTQTIDGVGLAAGDTVLCTGQTTGSQNGSYTVAAGAWTRTADFDDVNDAVRSPYWFVGEGTSYGGSGWVMTTWPYTIGTTSLTFVQFSGAGEIIAGNGLSKSGNTLSINTAVTVDVNSVQTLTNKSIIATQLTGTLAAGQFPALTGDVTTAAGNLATTIAAGVVTLAKLANLAASSVIGNSTGSLAPPTAVPLTSAPTASTVGFRDANANLSANNFIENATTTATAGTTTTLTIASAKIQQFTGAATQTVVLPNATTLAVGHQFYITNRSSGAVTVNANGGGLLQTLAASSYAIFTCVNNGTAAGTWDIGYTSGGGAGTVTTVSVAAANGFSGTVANAGTTPAITMQTSVTGVLKGNGTAISAATASTDYMAPGSFVTREAPAGAINGVNVTFTLANTPIVGTEMVFQNGILLQPLAGNDYTISGATITMLTAPPTGDKILVCYQK